MKLYVVKLTYRNVTLHVGCERSKGRAKWLMAKLVRDLCYADDLLKNEIETRTVSFYEWLRAK